MMKMFKVEYLDKVPPNEMLLKITLCDQIDAECESINDVLNFGCYAYVCAGNTRAALKKFWEMYDEFIEEGRVGFMTEEKE